MCWNKVFWQQEQTHSGLNSQYEWVHNFSWAHKSFTLKAASSIFAGHGYGLLTKAPVNVIVVSGWSMVVVQVVVNNIVAM